MTLEQMERLAEENLSSNYNGEEMEGNEIVVMENYTGEEDIYLDFTGGAKNFKNESKSDKRFKFTIKNETGEDQVVVLTPGSFPTERVAIPSTADAGVTYTIPAMVPEGEVAQTIVVDSSLPEMKYDNPAEVQKAGFAIDAVLDDGVIMKTAAGALTVTAPDTSRVRFFKNYIKSNPSRVTKMSFSTTHPAFYDTAIVLQEVSPYRRNGEDRIELQDFFDPKQFQEGKIVVTKGFQLDDVTVAYMTVPAGATIYATLNIGAVERSGLALQRKSEQAEGSKPTVKTLKVLGKR